MPSAANTIDYSTVLFDATGKPYWRRGDGTKLYLPPLVAAQSSNERAREWARGMGVDIPRDATGNVTGPVTNASAPGASYLRNRGEWNSETGEWDQGLNWNNIIATAVGAQIGAPYIAAAVSGPAAAGGASTPAATAAGTTVPTAATTAAATGWRRLLPDIIGTGLDVAGAFGGARASRDAADRQISAGDRSLEFQREMHERGVAGLQPWADTGTAGRDALTSRLGLQEGGTSVPPAMVLASRFGQPPGGGPRPAPTPPPAPSGPPPVLRPPQERPPTPPGEAPPPTSGPSLPPGGRPSPHVPGSTYGQPPMPPPEGGASRNALILEWLRNGGRGPMPGGYLPPGYQTGSIAQA